MLEFSEGKIQYFLVQLITLPNLRNLAEQWRRGSCSDRNPSAVKVKKVIQVQAKGGTQ